MPSLSDTLRQNLRAALVGRDAERAQFALWLAAESLPVHVVHVSGPGGVGKTTLLREFERLALDAGVPAAMLDMRDAGADPASVEISIEAAFRRAGILGGALGNGRRVLLLDTFEDAQGLDGWLQRVFLPAQSADLLVVVAGRHAPAPAWTADAAWADATATMPLGNLSPADAAAFLDRRDVPVASRADVLAFTHGFPLALALVAERFRQAPGVPFVPSEAPDIVRTLLERFLHDVPSPEHRTAVEGAALVRSVSEPLLTALLAESPPRPDPAGDGADTAEAALTLGAPGAPGALAERAHALFGWLRGLTFVESGPRGLVLHEVAREAIEADLRWRDAERHAALHARARHHYTARLLAPGAETATVLGDYVHLFRDNPVVQPLLGPLQGAWRSADVRPARPLRDADTEAVVALVRQHEGDAEAAIAAHWLAVRPESTEVFDGPDGAPAGFLMSLALDDAEARDRDADPLARAAWAAVERTRRPGERVLLFRFWMDAREHQGISAVQSLIFAQTVRHYLTTPRLAVSLLPVADADAWGPVLAFAGLARWPEAEVAGGSAGGSAGGRGGVFGMDWRAVPPSTWLETLAGRIPHAVPAPPARVSADGLAVLSQDAFAEAVRDALRDAARPHRLGGNPLLRTALVQTAAGPDADEPDRIAALVALLSEAAEALQGTPREAPLWNALRLTYFKPAPSQAVAAERLDVPFSTYRRHLTRGVAHVAETLWRRETGG